MPHSLLKLLPGVDTIKTLVLNEAAVSLCSNIRYAIDRSGLGLVQKLGGWLRFFPTAMPAIVRALWAWQDTNSRKWLAVGTDETTPGNGSFLGVINNGVLKDITPQVRQDNVTVDFSTTTGSDLVAILDTGSNVTDFDAVFIPTHVAVGGIIVFGFYQCIGASTNTFQIQLTDTLGNPVYATATEANGGAVAVFDTLINDSQVTVTLIDHGFARGDTFPVLVETAVGGLSLSGNYIINEIVDADTFRIIAGNEASSTDTKPINGGDVRLNFYLGAGPSPTGRGYGVGGYGTGGYGSGAVGPAPGPTNNTLSTTDWTIDNFGDIMVACPVNMDFGAPDNVSYIGGPIYWWSPITSSPSPLAIAQAPISNMGCFVGMPQRQVIAWGSTENGVPDPLLLRWCDIGNLFNWIGSPTNRAGRFRLSSGSYIVAGLRIGQQNIIFTDVGYWSMQYTGGQGVYSIVEMATGCGLIARKAAAALGSTLYWMGAQQFYRGSGEAIVCPIRDQIFQNLDTENAYKIRIAVNSLFGEITWYYPSLSGGTGEIDSYVKLNTLLPDGAGWDYGGIARTAWINQSVLGPPIGAGVDRLLYQHETSNDADGAAMVSYFRTGYFVLSEADMLVFIDELWPDMKWGQADGSSQNAQLQLTFYVREYPNGPDEIYGPYDLSATVQTIIPRLRGRLLSIEFRSSDVGSWWRLGGLRYRASPDGKYL